jgi:NAD+ synthase (glutamine-hydrolysing)
MTDGNRIRSDIDLPFEGAHRHGFVRVATCTPAVHIADPLKNADAIIGLIGQAEGRNVSLAVFPELCLTGYAIDDLHLQDALLDRVEEGLSRIADATGDIAVLVGAGLRRKGRLYNCAILVHAGRILGVVPKIFLPNYREYYEKRWFASGHGIVGKTIEVAGRTVPFGTDLIFASERDRNFVFHAEICEDFWAPNPPSIRGALAGASILCNLSASNIVVGKAADRGVLCASQSMRLMAAYIYSAAGAGESTTDLAWDGQGSIYEMGDLLAASERFSDVPQIAVADVDVGRIVQERMRTPTFNDAASFAGNPEDEFRTIQVPFGRQFKDGGLVRPLRRFPYVPNNAAGIDQDCYEAFNIQVDGLARRFRSTSGTKMILGVSGGLDSTHALIVAAKVCDRLGLPRSTILGFTLPGFATGDTTKGNAWRLMKALGIGAEEIDIRPAAERMLADMGHPYSRGEPVYDVTFENVQAGLRTDYLFRLANQRGGFVIGTGDLSEIALGWCTYGVGDQMSHYAVNAGVPKTLIQYLIRWSVRTEQFDPETCAVLTDILGTEISPELVPAGADGVIQSTQSKIGPYELHDFFLYHILRNGASPTKVAYLAWQAWKDKRLGAYPHGFADELKNEYSLQEIVGWLDVFLFRFFQISQFKRSAIPNGPKVSAGGSLSPRGDWRAPSDGTATAWRDELRRTFPNWVRPE